MEKFKSVGMNNLGICDYSKPYSYGHLNKQYIMLLSALKIPDDIFINKFKDYYNELGGILQDTEIAIKYLMKYNNIDLVNLMIIDPSSKDVRRRLEEILSLEIEKLPKLRVMIPKSRNVFGVADPTETLEYGQVLFIVLKIDH
jgi:hypothetical protein